jgi:hypothetical protein
MYLFYLEGRNIEAPTAYSKFKVETQASRCTCTVEATIFEIDQQDINKTIEFRPIYDLFKCFIHAFTFSTCISNYSRKYRSFTFLTTSLLLSN